MSLFETHRNAVELKTSNAEYTWGNRKDWVLFAGPDIFEDAGMVLEVATELKRATKELGIPWIFKCSFDKANRQSIDSFRGPGMETALKGLELVKSKVGCDLITDVHEVSQIKRVAEIADVIQIPAFLCRQTDLVVEAAKTGKVLHIKKGQFMAPGDMKSIVQKARSQGNENILLADRGTCFGYGRLINDMTGLVEMREYAPVVMDATHSVQLPGGKGGASDGRRDMIAVLARAAMAVGIDGLFLETHPNPDKALCDGPNSLELAKMPSLLKSLQSIRKGLLEI
ncbi:3-deoxy-8-phosphooctulonate synthase [bacterium]|nr:3-deoxy-8-phosphooctulonate synthase [bacterium]